MNINQYDNNRLCFIFCNQKLLLCRHGAGFCLPSFSQVSHLRLVFEYEFLHEERIFVADLAQDTALAPHFVFETLREAFMVLDASLRQSLGKAAQRVYWHKTHHFCGLCGSPTKEKNTERVKCCTVCGHEFYHRISPSIIVLVTRGEELLLARSPHFPPGLFSTLAGFVEPGESIEQTVHREVKEEVGIELDNVRYVGSQSWPFPHSLMLGFYATHKSGDIIVDGLEIEAAQWFSKDALPILPSDISIARQLIDGFLNAALSK